ncbi:MAG: hypothetical protein ABIV39_05475 [Verrucomicrobiota bacterium]
MPNENQPKMPRSIYPAIFLAAGLYVFIAGFSRIAPVLLAFILILLLTVALNPIVTRLRGLSGGRALATARVALDPGHSSVAQKLDPEAELEDVSNRKRD